MRIRIKNWIHIQQLMPVDPHSFFVDPDPAVFLNADPDPAAEKRRIRIQLNKICNSPAYSGAS